MTEATIVGYHVLNTRQNSVTGNFNGLKMESHGT